MALEDAVTPPLMYDSALMLLTAVKAEDEEESYDVNLLPYAETSLFVSDGHAAEETCPPKVTAFAHTSSNPGCKSEDTLQNRHDTPLRMADMDAESPNASNMEAKPADATNTDGLIDPANSERKVYRDSLGHTREIWRPGDGEGDQTTDYFERAGPQLPLEKKWRLFQTDIGPINNKNQPPRFVILDDRAACEVFKSEIPKSQIVAKWPHDFGGAGKVRHRRPHRGRPAIKDANAQGDLKFHSTVIGRGNSYYFKGEKDYEPIKYRYEPPKPEEPPKRKRKPEKGDPDYNPRAHGHNQYTPKEMLVKHGAQSFSEKEQPKNKLPRIGSFLRRERSPGFAQDRTLYGGIGQSSRAILDREKENAETPMRDEEPRTHRERTTEDSEMIDSSRFRSRTSLPTSFEKSQTATDDQSESDDELFPRSKPAPKPNIDDVLKNVEIPRDMSYVERRAFEQNLASRFVAGIETQEDTVRLCNELSQAMVKVDQQSQEIHQLKQSLEESTTATDWQAEAEDARAHAHTLEATIAAQQDEIQALREALELAEPEMV